MKNKYFKLIILFVLINILVLYFRNVQIAYLLGIATQAIGTLFLAKEENIHEQRD